LNKGLWLEVQSRIFLHALVFNEVDVNYHFSLWS